MKIGIVVAMKEELEALTSSLTITETYRIFDLTFYEANFANKKVIIVECGVGKVNAARTTQILIDNLKVDYIINIGVAGGISKRVNIGDIVIGRELVQHDFDITSFGHEKGYITGVGKMIPADEYLIRTFEASTQNEKINIVTGVIASGDIFCTDPKMSLKINQKFQADCVEMEGASVAQVCYLSNIPFLVLRSISDVVNGANEIDFETFLKSSSQIVAQCLLKTIDQIKENNT